MRFNPSHQSYGESHAGLVVQVPSGVLETRLKKEEVAEREQRIRCGPPETGRPPCRFPELSMTSERGPDGRLPTGPSPGHEKRITYYRELRQYLDRMVELPNGEWIPGPPPLPEESQPPSPPEPLQTSAGIVRNLGGLTEGATPVIILVLALAGYGIYSIARRKQ